MGKILAGLLCILVCVQADAQRRRRPSGPTRTPTPAPDPCEEPAGQWKLTCNPTALGWTAVDAPIPGTPGFRFWRRTNCPGDVAVAAELKEKGQTIWDFAVAYMGGKQPLFDGEVGCAKGNGGGPQLDVYLRHYPQSSTTKSTTTTPYDSVKCHPQPTYMSLKNHADYAVVHELIHSIQYAYDWPAALPNCPEEPKVLRWWTEATAAAGDALYAPHRNSRKEAIVHYLETPERPLDVPRNNEGYEIYLYPLFLAHTLDRGVIGRTWARLEHSSSMIEAIAGATGTAAGDGFLTLWPDFTQHLLNEAPWNLFETLDAVDQGVTPKDHTLALAAQQPHITLELPIEGLERLSAQFHRVKIGENVRQLTILNPNAEAPDPRVRMRVLIRKEGGVTEEDDWTDDVRKYFCIDARAERVTELVFVISNSDWEPGAPKKQLQPLKLIATNVGCWRYRGRASQTRTGQQLWRFEEFTFAINITESGSTSDVMFDVGPFPGPPGVPMPPELRTFLGAGGTVQWSWKGTWTPTPGCPTGSGGGNGSEQVTNGYAMILYTNGSRPDLPYYREYLANGFVRGTFPVCDSSGTEQIAFIQGNVFTIAPDGHMRVEGSRVETNAVGSMRQTLSWDLAPEREP